MASIPLCAVEWLRLHGIFIIIYFITAATRSTMIVCASFELLFLIWEWRRKRVRAAHQVLTNSVSVGEMIDAGVQALSKNKAEAEDASPASVGTPPWERGISAAFLQQFAQEYKVGKETTVEVCLRVVHSSTKATKCSFWEALTAAGAPSTWIGKPTTMVSHSWSTQFATLVDIVRTHDMRNSGADTPAYYFIDVFGLKQHNLAELSSIDNASESEIYNTLLKNLQLSITSAGHVLVAMDPWDAPGPFTRSWCLFELYIAETEKVKTSAGLSFEAHELFVEELTTDETLVDKILAQVDGRNAKASVESDRKMIFDKISDIPGGFDEFNDFLRRSFRGALQLAALQAVADIGVSSLQRRTRKATVSELLGSDRASSAPSAQAFLVEV